MPEHLEDFSAPWCQKILSDPEYKIIPLRNRLPPPKFASMGSNRCFAQTLNTSTSIRNYQPIFHPASDTTPREQLVLVSVGSGLDSWDGILSGGILCLLVDNVCAIMASVAFMGREAVTVELKTTFKRKMRTPGVVLCRAREMKGDNEVEIKEGERGRMLRVKGTVEDGMGEVYVEAEALFWDPGVRGGKVGAKKQKGTSGKKMQNGLRGEDGRKGDVEQSLKVKAKL